jgi:hypothetical protein
MRVSLSGPAESFPIVDLGGGLQFFRLEECKRYLVTVLQVWIRYLV